MLELLASVLEAFGSMGRRRPRDGFALRAVVAPPSSAAHREDFSHCWALVNTDVVGGAENVTLTWRRGPDGKPGDPVELGTVPHWQLAPLDGISRPSQRPPVSAEVSWTERDGSHRKLIVALD